MQEILSNLVAEQQFLDQYLQSIPIRNWGLKTTYKNWDITAHVSYLAALEDLTFNALKKNGSDFNKYKGQKGLEKFEKEELDYLKSKKFDFLYKNFKVINENSFTFIAVNKQKFYLHTKFTFLGKGKPTEIRKIFKLIKYITNK